MARTTLAARSAGPALGTAAGKLNKRSLGAELWRNRLFYLFLLPGTVYFILFHYVPMWELRLSFFDYGLGGVGEFVGLEHFRVAFESPGFGRAFWNTLILSSANIVIQMTLTIVISLLLNEVINQGFKKLVQTVIYLPHFLSWVVVASIFTLLLSQGGLVNRIVTAFGGDPIYFLGTPEWWRPVYLAILSWREVGWGTVIFLAALSGIDPELYEAARMDGSSRFQQMLYITLPHLYSVIAIVLIMNLAKIFNLFESVMVLYNSLVYEVSDVLQTYVYRTGIREFRFAYATAIGLFRSVIALVLVLAANTLTKRLKDED